MKLEAMEVVAPVRSGWSPLAGWLACAAATLIAAALAAQAWLAWRAQQAHTLSAPSGSLISVQLVNGQMYYGTLLEASAAAVKLGDVYYTQPFTQPNGQQGNRVVSRRKQDWHGPQWQWIPTERILQIEAVGLQSQLATLIAKDKVGSAK
jgi:hypothetical protein